MYTKKVWLRCLAQISNTNFFEGIQIDLNKKTNKTLGNSKQLQNNECSILIYCSCTSI